MSKARAATHAAVMVVVAVLANAAALAAQDLSGYASLMFDVVPHESVRAIELRPRLFAERRVDVGDHLRLTASGFAEALAARRRGEPAAAAVVRAQELHAEITWPAADLRVGLTRVVWGRLDEIQPTDVVNPLELRRFFLEGRGEARMPLAMVRGRWLPLEGLTLEGLYVPLFRRARFDDLEDASSPFNVAPTVPRMAREPAGDWRNAQGGLRLTATTGRLDWSLSTYRGFEAQPVYQLTSGGLEERFPRFTMVGGDFETIRGAWGVRGEVAAHLDRTVQLTDRPAAVKGRTLDAGIGVDRRAGDYRISANAIVSARSVAAPAPDRVETTILVAMDRRFARETRQIRTFAAYNPQSGSAFARVIAALSLRDDVALEASGGWFTGDGSDALSQFSSRDFACLRLKVFF